MSTAELRTEITDLLRQEENTSVLQAIRMLLRRAEAEDDDLTDADIAELEARRAARLNGGSRFHTVEESMRIAEAKSMRETISRSTADRAASMR